MAESGNGISRAEPLPAKEDKSTAIKISIQIPRRKLTLITITTLLNLLHWGSIICFFASIYQITSSPHDLTSIPSEVLTLVSALATIAYTYLHTIISLKQRIWTHQRKDRSAIKRTSYIAVRFVISLCVLWLLTCGWNMIVVARRPTCLPKAPGLQPWEIGSVCRIARLGMAFGIISLVASCILFGVLAAVRRPFEAHLFKHGYQQPNDPFATPSVSRNTSPVQRGTNTSEKQARERRMSASTRRSVSDSDVETLTLSSSPPLPTLHAPLPQRSVGMGIFTSHFAPPPIPPEYFAASRASSLDTLTPSFQPSASHRVLTRPPRLSGLVSSSGFVPLSIAPQYSASTWRALHPTSPSSMRPASRSQPHLPSSALSYRSRYSRSSVSITKPHRLSTATPAGSVACSSRSTSTGPEGRVTPTLSEDNPDRRAPASEIAFAIMNGTPIPGTTRPQTRGKGHMRTTSAPDTTMGAQQPDRMAMGWKPQLAGQTQEQRGKERLSLDTTLPIKLVRRVRSSSAELLSRFSPDSSPEKDTTPQRELERNLDLRARVMKELPFRRSRSADPMTKPEASGSVSFGLAEAAAAMISNMPHDVQVPKSRVLHSEPESQRRMTYDELKNKPLPKIAIL